MKTLFKFLFFVGLPFLVIGFYRSYLGALDYQLNANEDIRVVVDIKKGSSASDVADLLHSKGLIKSPFFFKAYLKQNELANQIKAGRLVFSSKSSLSELVDTLVAGKTTEMPVTLLEGWTAQQIGAHLASLELTTETEFLKCLQDCEFEFDFLPKAGYLEGYLYPDTYFVDPSSFTVERFISRLLNTFEQRLTDEDWLAIEKSGHRFEDIVIMASIVEREERNDKERPTVAGILWSRFDAGAGLGADATVLYGLGRTSGGLSSADLQLDSAYNTRKYRGLPPTPISNPSIESIRAAITPKKTNYWYYLHDPEGGIHYASSLDEHNTNKVKYLY